MANYRIAIPSYRRPEILLKRVLQFLEVHQVDKHDIDIFLANEAEFIEYERIIPQGYNYVIIGKPGIGHARQFMSEFYPNGQHIVYLDDDVKDIKELKMVDGKKKVHSILDFKILIKFMFERLIKENLRLCGITAVNNPFYLTDKITTDLKFIIGQFACVINASSLEKREFNLLEDYERTCNYYIADGGVLRYNMLYIDADYNKLPGGVSAIHYRDPASKDIELEAFIKKYPLLSKIQEKKSGKDIRLKGPCFKKKKSISSFWYGRELQHMELNTINSYLDKNYIFKLYIYNDYCYKDTIPNGVQICDASTIMDNTEIYTFDDTICSFSDIWRYNLIFKTGETWTDMDMMLINDLPDDEIIISSEFTNQAGALKCKELFRPNIGLMRFPIGSPFIKELIKECKIKKIKHNTEHMLTFRNLVKKHGYDYDVSSPYSFCPVGWQHGVHLFKTPYEDLRIKFGVEPPLLNDILKNSCCVHLWNNIYNKKNIQDIHPDSLYIKLVKSILPQHLITLPK